MGERKYKVGDVVRTLVDTDAEGTKLFPKGTIGVITEIISLYPYVVETNGDWWYYNEDMIEPVDEDGTPKQDPCYDTISRQAVVDTLDRMNKVLDEDRTVETYIDLLRECYTVLPPVTPKQRTGHWIRWYEQKETEWGIEHIPHCKCSECGKEYDPHSSQFIKYCNVCGAKMQEVEK